MSAHHFWDTQPVIQTEGEKPLVAGPIAEQKTVEDVLQDPYPLATTFEWWSPDYSNPDDVEAVYELLRDNYVEDKENIFRFKYSKEFLHWALTPPGYIPNWNVAVRRKSDKKMLGFIAGIPLKIRMEWNKGETIKDDGKPICEINFLCVHKVLRVKRLAPILIKEVTRRVNLTNIWQAVYTAGIELPTPFSVAPYYHRSLNPEKLVATGFSTVPHKLSKLRNPIMALARSLKLDDKPKTPNLRVMQKKDVPAVTTLLNNYLSTFQVAPVFNELEVAHYLLPRENILFTYVVDNGTEVTDFFSFYCIPSTVIGNARYSEIKAAYIHYYAHTATPLLQLMNDLLIIAQQNQFDVCNVVEILDGSTFTKDLKFNIGDGQLRYYFYNWAYPTIKPNKVGLVML